MVESFTGRRAMGAIGSPVILITSAHEADVSVSTINMVAGISFNPPKVAVSLSHHSKTGSLVNVSNDFALNVIGPGQIRLAKDIGSSTGHRINKFKEFKIDTFEADIISSPLLKAAHTILECKVEEFVDLGNHTLYIAGVVAYHSLSEDGPLYLYHGKYYSIGEVLGLF